MVVEETANGADECLAVVEKHKGKNAIFVLFCGKKDPTTGASWCPDCVAAEPVVESCLKSAPEDSVFIYCIVGDRASWKDPVNIFRTHEKFKLVAVPTLYKWGTPKRLIEEDCQKANLVQMFFEDDD